MDATMALAASTINAWRLASQRLHEPASGRPGEAVAWLGGVQAQDDTWARWSIALRMRDGRAHDVQRALDERRIVRTWAYRGTLHYLAAADLHWVLSIVAPRIIATNARRYAQLGLDEPALARSSEVIGRILRQEGPLMRSEIAARLQKEGISAQGQRAPYLLQRAALDRVICHGPPRGHEPTYVYRPDWLGTGAIADDDRDTQALAARYVISHGPATAHDFAWWTGLTVAAARKALRAASRIVRVGAEEQALWAIEDAVPQPEAVQGTAHLLPPFDEYLLGYADRSAALDPDYTKLVNRGGGMLQPTIVVDGKVIGIWRRESKGARTIVTLEPFRPLSAAERQAVEAAAGRYAAYLSMPVDLQTVGIG